MTNYKVHIYVQHLDLDRSICQVAITNKHVPILRQSLQYLHYCEPGDGPRPPEQVRVRELQQGAQAGPGHRHLELSLQVDIYTISYL